jgi:hypothetical protein
MHLTSPSVLSEICMVSESDRNLLVKTSFYKTHGVLTTHQRALRKVTSNQSVYGESSQFTEMRNNKCADLTPQNCILDTEMMSYSTFITGP